MCWMCEEEALYRAYLERTGAPVPGAAPQSPAQVDEIGTMPSNAAARPAVAAETEDPPIDAAAMVNGQ